MRTGHEIGCSFLVVSKNMSRKHNHRSATNQNSSLTQNDNVLLVRSALVSEIYRSSPLAPICCSLRGYGTSEVDAKTFHLAESYLSASFDNAEKSRTLWKSASPFPRHCHSNQQVGATNSSLYT